MTIESASFALLEKIILLKISFVAYEALINVGSKTRADLSEKEHFIVNS